jgi:GntR family histidine utilization transcriptional repressor
MKGWEAIRGDLRARIAARDWPAGAVLPTETELAAEYGVARGTVARALSDLAAAGLVERRRRAGTRVAPVPVRRAVLAIPVIRLEVEARGQVHGHRLLTECTTPPPLSVAAAMGVPAGTPLIHLETLHLADGRPFAREWRWLNQAALTGPLPDFTRITANEWLVATIPHATGEIAFTAAPADARAAEVLGVAPGTALFITERATRTEAHPVTWVRLDHAPGYRLVTAL